MHAHAEAAAAARQPIKETNTELDPIFTALRIETNLYCLDSRFGGTFDFRGKLAEKQQPTASGISENLSEFSL